MIRNIILIHLIVALCQHGMSQFGIQSFSGFNYFPESTSREVILPASSPHFSIGPSYWFRIKSKRIEFNPAVLFDYQSFSYSGSDPVSTFKEYQLAISFPIMFYPLDFNNDCNCPTFNKSGQFFEKGFHFILYASIPYAIFSPEIDAENRSNAPMRYQFGIGAGLDVGISKKWTLSPSLILSKQFRDSYSRNILNNKIGLPDDGRIRMDLMIRLLWYAKKKRY